MDVQFRFEDLEIWQRGAEISLPLFRIADELEQKKLYRFAEQLRGATMSITNNIAEGSGSVSDADFAHFVNIARRSVFEVANILIILGRKGCLDGIETKSMLNELAEQSRMLTGFRRSLL